MMILGIMLNFFKTIDKTLRKIPARTAEIAVVVGHKTAEYFEEMVVEHSASTNTAAGINLPANVNSLVSINTTTSSSLRLRRKVAVADTDTLDVVELDRQPTKKVVVYEIAEDNDEHLQTMLQKPEPKEAIKSKPKAIAIAKPKLKATTSRKKKKTSKSCFTIAFSLCQHATCC